MENRILTKNEIESLIVKGIYPLSNIKISYRFVISVNTKRLEFFEMFFNKFLGDNLVVSNKGNWDWNKNSIICSCNITDNPISFQLKNANYNRNGTSTEFSDILNGPTKTYENSIVEGVPYTRIIFDFNNCHSLVIAKVITDLTDCVNFTSDIYGYDKDGNEVLLIKFPIGSVVNIINSGNSDIDYIVSGYNYEREIKEFKYVIKRFEDGEVMGMIHISEDMIKPSRGNNLDILLGLN
jgi:hypothetical protein